MLEFILATGKYGVIGLAIVFVVVFILAEPGKEISFWGIKFHKKLPDYKNKFKKVPKKIPSNWKIILQAFQNSDKHVVHESVFFNEVLRIEGLSEMRCRELVSEMKPFGLVKLSGNYLYLNERAFPLINKYCQSNENETRV